MPTRQSSRLLRSTNADDAFEVDDEDAPSLKGEAIETNDSWVTVWAKLLAGKCGNAQHFPFPELK